MEAICQRNLPGLNIAVPMVEAIYFMPGTWDCVPIERGPLGITYPWEHLGSRTLGIEHPWDPQHLGSSTLGIAHPPWDTVHLGSRTLGIASPSNGVVPLGSPILGVAYPSKGIHTWDGVPLRCSEGQL